jgi:hypothetical protein
MDWSHLDGWMDMDGPQKSCWSWVHQGALHGCTMMATDEMTCLPAKPMPKVSHVAKIVCSRHVPTEPSNLASYGGHGHFLRWKRTGLIPLLPQPYTILFSDRSCFFSEKYENKIENRIGCTGAGTKNRIRSFPSIFTVSRFYSEWFRFYLFFY